ncbi:hypothetical protein [Sulfitobacter mediterraneus]|uniref:Uncharacterized protein n=1 Tax=Sulfitobacter mediterraneus TaxID=83219 RepID=A0A2T6BU25_9RHOB|nr:hypothetical protein [Sulfitobacter mediterraneus]KIN75566.1 hypothetical protein Z950_2782 [Sulfitobacter mediterraneus KCTC 32188]PTX59569.1 hypothetical protein C8N31_1303 [Sulfitobacter mediterraneus]
MFTTFTLLLAAGVCFRLALSYALKRRYDLALVVPQGIAVLLIVLAVIPSWALPVTLPVPLGFVLGAVLPDLIFRRG